MVGQTCRPRDRQSLYSSRNQASGPAAREYAEAKGVLAIAPEDLATDDPAFKIVNRLRSIWPKVLSLTPERAEVAVLPPDADAGWIPAPPDLDVFLDDETEVGSFIDVVRGVINANFPKVAENIGLADIEDDLTAPFTLQVGPGWTISMDGKERRLCARYIKDGRAELHPIDGFRVQGTANVKVSEVPLTHRRLGEVTYAYGEGMIGDRDALIVVTESASGGTLTTVIRPGREPGSEPT